MAGEITAVTGIPIAVVDAQANKRVGAFGTNATLHIRVAASEIPDSEIDVDI